VWDVQVPDRTAVLIDDSELGVSANRQGDAEFDDDLVTRDYVRVATRKEKPLL
jgi:hypothetical protein